MWKCFGVLCCVIVAIACLSPVSASPAGRTLTSSESWSVYGGSNNLCYTGMGRCYAYPDTCSLNEGPGCDGNIEYISIGHDLTCVNWGTSGTNCVEGGTQEFCLKYNTCFSVTNPQGQEFCFGDLATQQTDSVKGPTDLGDSDSCAGN